MIGYAVLGFGMGIFMLIVAYKGYIEDVIDIRFRKDMVLLEGEVVDFVKVKNFRLTGCLICPVISFSYNGISKEELVAEGNARTRNKYKLNQKVIICYNPTLFEKKVIIKNDYRDIWTSIIVLIMAFSWIGIGIAATYYGIKHDIFI